jgi:acyl-coenzyme A thioesterase PaaI-like protein
LASGVAVESFNEDLTEVTVRMKQYFFNTNYVGSHFGGSLFSMTDPFIMFMLLHHLKKDHIVWDQGASIEFVKPAYGKVRAFFITPNERIEEIKKECLEDFSTRPEFIVEIKDKNDDIVARVTKTLYVRRKDAKERFKRS